MSADNEVKALLSLAAKRGLIAPDHVASITLRIESDVDGQLTGMTPVVQLLVEEGHITARQADLLVSEFAKTRGPRVIGGHQLLAKLGEGGMGTVYRAIQLSMQREVALKVLSRALGRDREFAERFVREARAAGKVVHPNVITCYDVGIDRGVAYMSLELVPGGDALKRLQAAGGRLPEREALGIVRDCARGLTAIARAGLIHRDIKPANIFLTEDGTAKLADLGLARSASGEDRMTLTGMAVGSPAYMAPEQAMGLDDIDIRADIYSLGATLFHFICGRKPFSGSTAFATVNQVIYDPIPDPRTLAPTISGESLAIIHRAMAKDRDERYDDPEALLAAVEAALASPLAPARRPAGLPVVAARSGAAPGGRIADRLDGPSARAGTRGEGVGSETSPRALRPRRRLVARIAMITGAVVLVSATATGMVLRRGSTGASPEPSAPAVVPALAATPPASAVQADSPVSGSVGSPNPADAVAALQPPKAESTVREDLPPPLAPTPAQPIDRPASAPDQASAPAPAPAPAPAALPAEAVAPPPEDQAVAPVATPDWTAKAVDVLDRAMAGDLVAAATLAAPLPSEIRDAVAALQTARAALPRLYVAQQAALVAAGLRLPSMPDLPGMRLAGFSDKGVRFAAGEHAGTTLPWDRLAQRDHVVLRAALAAAPLTAEQRLLLARAALDASTLALADAADPVIATFQRLARLKIEAAAEAERLRAAERARTALLREVGIDLTALDPRTQRLLASLSAVVTREPTVISEPVDRRIELRDFVIIRADVTMVAGGELIPIPGALVLNGSSKAYYEAIEVPGVPFVSCSIHAGQTFSPHGFERNRTFANGVFYGNVLLDPAQSPRFRECAFIGGTTTRDVVMWEKTQQRLGQIQACDFHRLRLRSARPIAASDRCAFSACDLVGPPGEAVSGDISAWDAKGALQAQLSARGVPVRIRPRSGPEQTLLGPDVAAVTKVLDRVVAVWGSKVLGW